MPPPSSAARWSNGSVLVVCLVVASVGFLAGRPGARLPASRASASSQAATPPPHAPRAAEISSLAGLSQTPATRPWDSEWDEAFAQPNTPARNARLAALLEALAQTDPQRALALARSVADWRLRDLLRAAALRGWAEVAPEEAADWALASRTDERRSVVEAVMQGAARNPPAAVRAALRLCATDPERAGDYGHYTIDALADRGAFDSALAFGLEIGADKYPFLLKSALFQWGRNQPATALAALDTIADPIARGLARGEALAGWAWADAKGLSEYALTLPPGGDRAQILAEALPRWVEKDPLAASDWLNRFGQNPDADAGVAALANLQSIITQQPTLAMELARGISSPAERNHTRRAVFRQWAQHDRGAAQRFLAATTDTDERAVLQAEINDLFPPENP